MDNNDSMDPQRPGQGNKVQRVEVYWHAVSYKTVAMVLLLAVALIFVSIYFVFPNVYAYVVKKVTEAGTPDLDPMANGQSKIKFVNLDGRVQVKKVNSVQWVDADFHTVLDKGDLIQTGADGIARIAFADSTITSLTNRPAPRCTSIPVRSISLPPAPRMRARQ